MGLAGNATTLLIPLAMGIAIVRYRLFEFDRLVSRTIAYAAITLVLAAIFAAASVGFGAVLGSLAEGEAISATIATLIAATSFSTLRRRVQPFVDRRFDRARYDGVRAVEGPPPACETTWNWTACVALCWASSTRPSIRRI